MEHTVRQHLPPKPEDHSLTSKPPPSLDTKDKQEQPDTQIGRPGTPTPSTHPVQSRTITFNTAPAAHRWIEAKPEWNGLKVTGSYGSLLIVESHFVPKDYVAVFASAGADHEANVIGFRSHKNPAYHGLRVIPGDGPYPLISSYLQRSFGVGTRHRGAGVAIQVTESASYTAPVIRFAR